MQEMDTLTSAFLASFLIGLLSILAMLALGALHHGGDGAGNGDGGHGDGDGGHGDGGHGDGGHGPGHAVWGAVAPMFNVTSLLALLMVGGAAGFLSLRSGLARILAVAMAAAFGVGGARLMVAVMRLLARMESGVVLPGDPLGTVGRVIAPIAAGRMGEIVFSKDGARQALPARADEEGLAIGPDTEVVVMRVEKGVAYVRPITELLAPAKEK